MMRKQFLGLEERGSIRHQQRGCRRSSSKEKDHASIISKSRR
jgi:hypothetical protein